MTASEPAIGFLPYGTDLGRDLSRKPIAEVNWPLGCPERLTGCTVGDLLPSDHLICFPKTMHHLNPRRGTRAQISLVLGEPSVIHAKHLALLRVTYRRFYRVLSFNEQLLADIPNGIFFPYGTTWVPNWRDLPRDKSRMISLIASSKKDTTGHKLRHAVVDWVRDSGQEVDVMGRGYTPFDEKSDGLAPYRYSIVIENVREANYFSEKLLDAVFCDTVPIYWGCPNLDRFIDPDGIIQCVSEEDVRRAVQAASESDFQARLPRIRAIQPQLDQYADIERRAVEVIRDSLAKT